MPFSRRQVIVVALGIDAVSADLRRTPFGLRPAECVMQAPHGSVISGPHDNGALLLLHSPGADPVTVEVPESCHVYEALRLEAEAEKLAETAAIPDGYFTTAGAFYTEYTINMREMNKFTGQFTVPPAPPTPQQPETVYYFIGLQDRSMGKLTSIHQPVLTWGDETEGGIGGWHLWSWTCCPGNVTWHSEDIHGFAPGDTVYGAIEKVADATWQIDSAVQDAGGSWHNTSLTSQVGNYNFNYADVALEVYNVTNCDQLPHGTSSFTNLEITLSDGSSWMPTQWYVSGSSSECEVKTTIHDIHNMDMSTNAHTQAEVSV